MSTAIIAHADRDGIAASALIVKHLETAARVFPVGRAGDVDTILRSCSEGSCPRRFFIVGYACEVTEDTWLDLGKENPRVFWFDHHVDAWTRGPRPPADMVKVFLPQPGERNAPASMVAEYIFREAGNLPDEDRRLLAGIYEATPADEVVDFIDGLHAEIRGVDFSEMTDFVQAVLKRKVPPHYARYLETARRLRGEVQHFLDQNPRAWRVEGPAVLLRHEGELNGVPRAVLAAWLRTATGTRVAVNDLGGGRLYVNMRHDVALDLHGVVREVKGLHFDYASGHPYVVFLDGCSLAQGGDPGEVVLNHLAKKVFELG